MWNLTMSLASGMRRAFWQPMEFRRNISALYMTGDKAKDNYVTLQPYLDFEDTFSYKAALEESIALRKMDINLQEVLEKYGEYRKCAAQQELLENKREDVTIALKKLLKTEATTKECDALKAQGKLLREKLKSLKEHLYPIEYQFIHMYLNLPNLLHKSNSIKGKEKLLYQNILLESSKSVSAGSCHTKHKDLMRIEDHSRYYLFGDAAWFDLRSAQALSQYFVHRGGFTPMANPDFVRCVLLEANSTPLLRYHRVIEEQLQNTINNAFLTGGGSFESFLGAVTKLCVYPSVLPLRWVSCGRTYERELDFPKLPNLFTVTQSNAVQTFVATAKPTEADEQMDTILNLAVDFYKALGLPFRIKYADPEALIPAECLRASIEVYSPSQKRYVCIGYVSHYSDFVSKRILFSMREQKHYHFLHIVGGPVLLTSRLIGALIEHNIVLKDCVLLEDSSKETSTSNGIAEFKSLFK